MRCACVTKFASDESVMTTCADAMALSWFRDHACSSWTEATPGIYHSSFSGGYCARVYTVLVYHFQIMLHIVNVDSEGDACQ